MKLKDIVTVYSMQNTLSYAYYLDYSSESDSKFPTMMAELKSIELNSKKEFNEFLVMNEVISSIYENAEVIHVEDIHEAIYRADEKVYDVSKRFLTNIIMLNKKTYESMNFEVNKEVIINDLMQDNEMLLFINSEDMMSVTGIVGIYQDRYDFKLVNKNLAVRVVIKN